MTYPSGYEYQRCEGTWSYDRCCGGKATNADGTVLEGEWQRHTIYNGKGVMYHNGERFEGTWVEGGPRGPMKATFKNRNKYVGLLSSSRKPRGYGVMTYVNGDAYEGMWGHIFQRHGKGKYINADGTILDGEWSRNHVENGTGKYTARDGTVYEGTWVAGVLRGKHTHVNGTSLEGEFIKVRSDLPWLRGK